MAEQTERDPLYVGYLPLPKSIKRFIVPWLIGNLVLAVGIAAVVAQQHREPGDGVWETGRVTKIEGTLVIDPYPLLKTSEGTYLLVEQGKIGAVGRVKDLRAGNNYEISGYIIEREGRKVLEIDSSIDNPIRAIGGDLSVPIGLDFADTSTIFPEMLGTHTLRGEIVDPKCYLGVMQPGDGKTHKTCATLCIKGGIPPMLVVRDKSGNTAAYLVTDAEGNAFPESHHEYIADPIEITGQVLRDGDLLVLRADLDSIRRLHAKD
jgi:hypothetical protein